MSRRMQWGAGGLALCAGVFLLSAAIQPPSAPGNVAGERVSLDGIPVSGKTRDEVAKLAGEIAARLLSHPVTVRYQKRSERTTPVKLGAKADVDAALGAVFAADPGDQNLLVRLREKVTGPDARNVALPVHVTEAGVAQGLKRFSAKIGVEPRNARLTTVKGKLTPIPPKPGKELDFAALAHGLQAALDAAPLREHAATSAQSSSPRADWLQGREPIALNATTRDAQPRITLEQLAPITKLLASFSTGLGGSSRNRVHNVTLACRAIDGTVLLPGDVFSYNDTVGPRVPSAGFREAPVIVKGELQPGLGGGICQVSSTLYNAALLADMEIVRRSHHAFPVHYLPAGRDATVVDGAVDFRFKNRLEHPIAIDAKVVGRRVVMNLYGHPDDKCQVQILSSRVSRIGSGSTTVSDPRLPRGRRVVAKGGRDGRRVTVSRVVKKAGEVLRREVISRDTYRPFAGLVRVGTGDPLPKPAPRSAPKNEAPAAPPAEPAAPAPVPAAPGEE